MNASEPSRTVARSPEPTVAVIIPSYRALTHIGACLDALQRQSQVPDACLIVDSSPPPEQSALKAAVLGRAQVHGLERRTPPAAARNIGAAACHADILCFLDSDCIPAADWLERLTAGLAPGEVRAAAIRNAYPCHPVAVAEYLIEFREFAPSRRRRPLRFVPSYAMALHKTLFDRVGGFPDVRASEDTLLGAALRDSGIAMVFVPDAVVDHAGRRHIRPWLQNMAMLGRHAARARAQAELPGRWLLHTPWLWPLLPLMLLGRTLWHATRAGSIRGAVRLLGGCLWTAPWLVLGAMFWSAGFCRGALEAPSGATRK